MKIRDLKVKDYLRKEPKEQLLLIQARISKGLANELKPFMKKHKHKWTDVVRASLMYLRDQEVKGKK